MKTKLEQYQEMQAMVRKEIETMFPTLYKNIATQYGVNNSPVHYHNGVDLPRLNKSELIDTPKYQTQLVLLASEVFSLKSFFPGFSKITFYGFAANNAGGGAATKRLHINGEANFGRCYEFTGSGSSISITTTQNGIPLVQASNFIYADGATLGNSRVGSSGNLVYGEDNTGQVVKITVSPIDKNGNVTFTATLSATWQVTGVLIFS